MKRVVHEAVTNAEKGQLFFETFFPPKPAISTVPEDTPYLRPRWAFENITDEQIHLR
jgi:hypothetical protein